MWLCDRVGLESRQLMNQYPLKTAFFLLSLAAIAFGAGPATQPATRPGKIVFSLELLATPDGQDKPDEKKLKDYQNTVDRLLETKNSPVAYRTREDWTLDRELCKKLDTPALAMECFKTSTIGFQMGKYSSPVGGFLELSVFHNSFSELLTREDMWVGVSRVLDNVSQKLADPNTDFNSIVSISMTATPIIELSRMAPMRQQLKSHEAEYLGTLIKTIKAYQTRVNATQTKSAGFFGEPTWFVSLALDYVKVVNPQKYPDIEQKIRSFKFQKEQQIEDLKKYLDLALPALESSLIDAPNTK